MPALPSFIDVSMCDDEIAGVAERLGHLFARSEPRRRVVAYLRGLLSDAERKNGWQLAEKIGDATPFAVQHLMGRADRDADEARDDLVHYIHDHLADPRGVLIVDETGFLKKAARRREARIPEEVSFATKPRLAERMLERARRAGVEAAWATGDAVYGSDVKFRRALESRGRPYVLAVRSDQRLWVDLKQVRVDKIAADLPADSWHEQSAGAGSKGPRWFDWAVQEFGPVDERGWRLWLLARRHREKAQERAYYLCRGSAETPWTELARVAGARWAIEESSERAKGDCGLDEYEVRSWVGWYRHVTLSMFGLAVLRAIRSRAISSGAEKEGARADPAHGARGEDAAAGGRLEASQAGHGLEDPGVLGQPGMAQDHDRTSRRRGPPAHRPGYPQ